MSIIVTDRKILRQVSRPTTHEEVQRLGLIKLLMHSNRSAWTAGAGLAAIQIGIPLRFAWYCIPGKAEGTLFNPVILKRYGSQTAEEGCLSIPNKSLSVSRAFEIEYLTNGKKKRASGILARLIQHEIDHMDGILMDERPLS